MSLFELLFAAGAIVLCLVTVLPEMRETSWVIRMFDIPRLQISALLAVLIPLGGLLENPPYVLWAMLAAALAWQIAKILPFTPLGHTEIALTPDAPDTLKMLVSNVLLENDQHGALADLIRDEDPDIVFLMEIDDVWSRAMAPV